MSGLQGGHSEYQTLNPATSKSYLLGSYRVSGRTKSSFSKPPKSAPTSLERDCRSNGHCAERKKRKVTAQFSKSMSVVIF